jgi:predicted RND superfamily exporter protein
MITALVRIHRPFLLMAAILTAASVVLLFDPGLKQDYRLEAFVASRDDSYRRFRHFMEEFSSNEIAIIAVEGHNPRSPDLLQVVEDLTRQVRTLKPVQQVFSIADIPSGVRAVLGDRLLTHPLFRDNIISRDGRTAAIAMQMSGEDTGGEVRKHTVARLRALVADARRAHPELAIILAGPYVTLIDMYEYVQRDLIVFSLAAFGMLVVTLWIVFRHWRPMVYATAVSASATLCTLGLAIVCGFVTSLITQMIVILVAVLSVASCVHLAVATEETTLRLPTADRREQALATLRRMIPPCTVVIATTAAGFASVCISPISPIRLFGLLMVCGLGISLVWAFPATVAIAGSEPSRAARTWLPRGLRRVARFSDRRRGFTFALFAVATAYCALGARRLQFESDFVKNFRTHSEVRQSYYFLGRRLAPVGSMEIVVRADDHRDMLTPANVRTADVFARDMVERYPSVRKAQTLGDVLTLLGADLPDSELDLRVRLGLVEAVPGGKEFLRNFLNEDRSAMRVNFRVTEGVPVDEKLRVAHEVRDAARAAFGDGFSVEVTGLYYFYATLIRGLVRDQYRSVAIAIPAVFVLMLLLLRSWRVALLAMVPNLLPIVFCLGAMGWTRIPVNMTTAMMLSVIFGIAVDDTLHYLWRFREELAAAGDYHAALLATHASVGRACTFTTVVIAGGFWILVLSEFLPTAYFGGLIGFTMMGALAADLLLLPALLITFKPFGRCRA